MSIIHNFFRWMFVWVMKMLEYERIDILEGIDLDKTDKSKEYEFFYYNYFSNGYKLDSKVCNDFNSRITAFRLEHFEIINVKGVGYKIFIFDLTKDNVHNILGCFESSELQNVNLWMKWCFERNWFW